MEPDNPLDCYMLPDFLSKAAAAAKAENIPVRTDVQPDTTFDAKLLRDGPAEDTMKVLLGLLDQASPATCKKVRLHLDTYISSGVARPCSPILTCCNSMIA